MRHVHRQIHQHVDSVVANLPGKIGIAHLAHVVPDIRRRIEVRGQVVGAKDAGIAMNLIMFMVMPFQQRHDEKRFGL